MTEKASFLFSLYFIHLVLHSYLFFQSLFMHHWKSTFNCDNESFKGNFTSLFKGLSQSENHFIGTFISRFTNRKAINLMNYSETANKC